MKKMEKKQFCSSLISVGVVALLCIIAVLGIAGCDNSGGPGSKKTDTYTVTFDTGGGNAIAAKTVEEGGTLGTGLTDPTYADHAFVAWFTSSTDVAADKVFTSATPVTGDITVYAKWVDAVTYGDTEDGDLILNPSGFSGGDDAAVAGDVVTYTGGVVDYLFPTEEFDINDYEALEVKYFVYGWEPEVKSDSPYDTIQFVTKTWDGNTPRPDDGSNNINYPNGVKGEGAFKLEGENFAKLQVADITAFSVGPNTYQQSSIANFKVKFYSIKLKLIVEAGPAPAGTPVDFSTPVIYGDIGYSTGNSDVVNDPLDVQGKVLKTTVTNYNQAPWIAFDLGAKTLGDYASLDLKLYRASGDVEYKSFDVYASSTVPTGQFAGGATYGVKIGTLSVQGGDTAWTDATVPFVFTAIPDTEALTGTVYLAFGISCDNKGSFGGADSPTVWYADDVNLAE